MASHPVIMPNILKFRFFNTANSHAPMAPGVKMTAVRRIYGTGDIACKDDAFPLAVHQGRRDWNRRKQGFSIRMDGMVVEFIAASNFYNFSQVHYRDPVTDVAYYRKVMGDE
jgi:hypothetical protein